MGTIELFALDLSDFASIRALAPQLTPKSINAVIFNAGVAPSTSDVRTAQGFELAFGTNYLGNFLLTKELLARDVFITPDARIVTVSSEFHRCIEQLNITALGEITPYNWLQGLDFYSHSKLCLTTFMQELSHRLNTSGISVHTICPGPVATDITRSAPSYIRPIVDWGTRLAFQTPEKAAKPVNF